MRQLYRILVVGMLSLGSFTLCAQSADQNYVYSWDVIKATKTDNFSNTTHDTIAKKSIQYFDGLGRPIQTVQKGFTPKNKDWIKPYKYNEFGIDTVNFQSYSDGYSNASFRTSVDSKHEDFYQQRFGDNKGMSPVLLEKSPLAKLIKQGAPGTNWQINSHPVRYEYCTNNLNTAEFKVKKWVVNGNTCSFSGLYPANDLYCTIAYNEDSVPSYEFKDYQGNIVLKRMKLSTNNFTDTYYIYDIYNLLRFVISPVGSDSITGNFSASDDFVKKFAYFYRYDTKKRLIEKRIPGKESEYYVYNSANQVILYQDGNMRKSVSGTPANEWKFTKYDALGRVIITGITCLFPRESRDQLQALADDSEHNYEKLVKASTYPMPYNNYYSNNSFPILEQHPKYFTLNYYDRYDIGTATGRMPIIFERDMSFTPSDATFVIQEPDLNYCKGKSTVSYVDFCGTLLPSVTFYDSRGRTVQSRSVNHLKGIDVNSFLYSKLTSSVLRSEHKHTTNFNGNIVCKTEKYKYTYDEEYRISQREYSSDNLPLQIVNFKYDELGNLISKEIKENTSTKQMINFDYNIRGWLTKINEPDIFSTSGDYFAMKLYYDKDELNERLYTQPRFNGNICGMKWQTMSPSGIIDPELLGMKGYKFSYDDLNRLMAAYYIEDIDGRMEQTNRYRENTHEYDKNGNMQNLRRYGNPNSDALLAMDGLTFHYDGNRVIAIDDSNPYNNGNDFCDNGHYYNMGSDTLEYYYDANGNLKKDVNKGILNITYNDLNLPTVIDKTGNYRIEYEYDALGNKHRQTVIHGGKVAKVTDFVGNFVYERNHLAWQSFDEGRVVYKNDSTCFAETYIKDHLGNVRVAFGNDGSGFGVRQVNAYYPFGMSIRTLSANSLNTTHRNEYGYNGKMYQDELGLNWYDYGARFYDPVVGRWWSVDPLAADYDNLSPYGYCSGNPIKHIDVNGEFIGTIIGTVVGGVTGAYDSYKKGGDIWAGAAEGAVSGAIAGAAVDITVAATVATGGGALVVIGAGMAAGAIGGAAGAVAGDATGQVVTNVNKGSSISNAIGKVTTTNMSSKAKTGAITGAIGGATGGALGKGLQAASNSTKAVQGTMSKNITSTAKTLTKMGGNEKTVGTAVNKITTGMGEAGKNTVKTTNKVAAGSAMATESAIKVGQMKKEGKN